MPRLALRGLKLIVIGDRASMISTGLSFRRFECAASAQLSIYPDIGHGGVFQYHEVFFGQVMSFWRNQQRLSNTPLARFQERRVDGSLFLLLKADAGSESNTLETANLRRSRGRTGMVILLPPSDCADGNELATQKLHGVKHLGGRVRRVAEGSQRRLIDTSEGYPCSALMRLRKVSVAPNAQHAEAVSNGC